MLNLNLRGRLAVIACVLLFLSPKLPIQALYVEDSEQGFVFDLPVGWERIEEDVESGEDVRIAEDDLPEGVPPAAVTVRGYTRESMEAWVFTAEHAELELDMLMEAGAEATTASGDAAFFQYNGQDAFFADVARDNGHSGYMVAVEFRDYAGVLFVTAPEQVRMDFEHELLSVADSLSPLEPVSGAVTTFFEGHGGANEEVEIRFPGPDVRADSPQSSVEFATARTAIESSDMIVEREAGLLAGYEFNGMPAEDQARLSVGRDDAPDWLRAWRRYFRIIYRDNYRRLGELAGQIRAYIDEHQVGEQERADLVLSWLQAFDYHQPKNSGRFQPPVTGLLSGSGDCDSLAIIYAIILDHLGIEAHMLVSVEHGHGIAVVPSHDAEPGSGEPQGRPLGVEASEEATRTTFDIDGTAYLPAEMTTAWPLGYIAGDQVDASAWHLVAF